MSSNLFWQGVEEFNRGSFYACHDTLEAIWHEAPTSDRNFYQGVLQIAVGCYHLSDRNWRGAAMLLGEGISRLQDYEPDYEGIDISQLREESIELLAWLQKVISSEAADAPPQTPFPQIRQVGS